MKRFIILLLVLTMTSACKEQVYIENQGQRYQFCTLESCEDELSAVVRVIPRPDQVAMTKEECDPDQPYVTRLNSYYDIDKSNWVARIRLVNVPWDKDFLISDNNTTITSKQVQFCNSFDPHLSRINVVLTAAMVTSDIIITADCQLYGRQAGTNLADKFCIPYFPKGQSNEQYLVSYEEPYIIADLFDEDIVPMALTDYFFSGVMVHRAFWLQPSEIHEENPEIIHFHVEYNAWTELFEPYADMVRPDYVSKGADRHLFADFEVDLSGKDKVIGWRKDELCKYPSCLY